MLHVLEVGNVVHEVLLGHLTAGTGGGHVGQVDAEFLSGQTHRRSRQGRAVRNLLRRQGLRGSRVLRRCRGLGGDGLVGQTLNHRVQGTVLHKARGSLGQLAEQALVAVYRVGGGVRHRCLNCRRRG